jgi:hypothetical protein
MITTITLTAQTTDFSTNISPPILLDLNKKYEAALLSIDLYNSIPNITPGNNSFTYSTDSGITWKTVALPTGSYGVEAINNEIQRQMTVNGDYSVGNDEFYITILVNMTELKSVVEITNRTYRINFGEDNSIGLTLGFQPQILSFGQHTSQNIIDITQTNCVLVNVDIVSGGYVNGIQSQAMYSFDPHQVPPGYKINEKPNPVLIYYPINRHFIDSVRVWLTDQNNKPIDLRGERVTVKLCIRENKDK